MENNLHLLASKLGIAKTFSDAGMKKRDYVVSDDVLRFFCSCLGYEAKDEETALKSIKKFEDKKVKTVLENIIITKVNKLEFCANLTSFDENFSIAVNLAGDDNKQNLEFDVEIGNEDLAG